MTVAVICLGGKQYTVTPGKIIGVQHLPNKVGEQLIFDDILNHKKVEATIVEQNRSRKIRVVKFKNKTRYTRTIGHRHQVTSLKIDQIKD